MSVRVIALAVAAVAILAFAVGVAGASPAEAARALLQGSLGSPGAFAGTLRETTPLLITGLAVFFALRAGLFNIGVEGQFLLGALGAAVVALRIPGLPGIVAGLLVGMALGALWALPAGLIRAYRNGHEVITTIMLNNIAVLLTTALVSGPFKDPNQDSSTTVRLVSRLPNLYSKPPMSVNISLALGLILVAVVAWWLRKTVKGYELEATGANASAAEFAGVRTARVRVNAMLISGAVAGLGGALQVVATEGRFYAGFSPGYGYDGLGIALLAGSNAVAVIPGAFLFGILAKGGVALGIAGIPKGITTVSIGLLILVAAATRYRKEKRVD